MQRRLWPKCYTLNFHIARSLTFSLFHALRRFSATTSDHQLLRRFQDDCKAALDLKAVVKTHAKMVKFGFVIDPSLVCSLMLSYINCGHLNFSWSILDEIPCWNVDLVTSNKFIAKFMKHGDVGAARKVFLKMPSKDVVSWNSMISGYVKNSSFEEALRMFKDMCSLGIEPDEYTFSSVITACSRLGALSYGLWVHDLIKKRKSAMNSIVVAALIHMYAKCGKIEMAKEVFDSNRSSDLSVWNAMITGLAIHGLAFNAISVFSKMETEYVSPDAVTFVGILTACSHSGEVKTGQTYFDIMREKYSIEPELEHYGAMVDLFGRAGLLEQAYDTIKAMPMEPDIVVWKALLSACRTHKNPTMGEIAIANIPFLDSGDYVLLSNTYCSLNKWSSSAKMRDIMKREGVRKNRAKSWIELAGVIHHFRAGAHSHPEDIH